MHGHGARFDLNALASTGGAVGSDAIAFDGAVLRRHLLNLAAELVEHQIQFLLADVGNRRGLDDLALAVVGVG